MSWWIIFIPVIIFFNGFALGKVYKRFNVHLNSYFSLSIGIATFFGFFGLMFVFLILFNISFELILYFSLIAQGVLVLLYLFNWRWLFISYVIDWKQLLIFSGVIIVFALGYILTREFKLDNINWLIEKNVDSYLKYTTVKPSEITIFRHDTNYMNINFVNYFYAILVFIFQIQSVTDLQIFYTYVNILIYVMLGALVCMAVFMRDIYKRNTKNLIISFVSIFFISLLGFVFSDFFWMFIFTIFLVNVQSLKQNELRSNISIYVINMIVMSGFVFSIHFVVLALIINLTASFLSYQSKKENATDFNVLMMFTSLLIIAISFNNIYYIGYILLVLVVAIYTFFIFYKSSNIAAKVNKKIDNFMYSNVNFIIIFLTVSIIIASLALFFTNRNYELDISMWLITKIGLPVKGLATDTSNYTLINTTFWIINVLLLLVSVLNSRIVHSKQVPRLKHANEIIWSQFDMAILVIIVFWNPIIINTYVNLNALKILNFVVNFQIIFLAVLTPCIFAFSRHLLTIKKFDYLAITYLGIILASSGIFIAALNM